MSLGPESSLLEANTPMNKSSGVAEHGVNKRRPGTSPPPQRRKLSRGLLAEPRRCCVRGLETISESADGTGQGGLAEFGDD